MGGPRRQERTVTEGRKEKVSPGQWATPRTRLQQNDVAQEKAQTPGAATDLEELKETSVDKQNIS